MTKSTKPVSMTKNRTRIVRTVAEFNGHILKLSDLPDKANADIGVLVSRGIIDVTDIFGRVIKGKNFPKVMPPKAPGTGAYLLNPTNQQASDERKAKILMREASRATILDVDTGQPIRVKAEGKSKAAKRARGRQKKFDRKVAKVRAEDKRIADEAEAKAEEERLRDMDMKAKEEDFAIHIAPLPTKTYFKLKREMVELYPQMTDAACKRLREGELITPPGGPGSFNTLELGAEKVGNAWKYYQLAYPNVQ